jgi:hypothetical protein
MPAAFCSKALAQERRMFRAPYGDYPDGALLEHFGTRCGVAYFPVIDAHEAGRAKIDAMLENRFEFVGETYHLQEPLDWLKNPSRDIEWHILQHKFYYAVGLGVAYAETADPRYLDKWTALTSSWMDQTPPGFIASDVTGRRIQNWIYAYYYFVTEAKGRRVSPLFHRAFLASLYQQVAYLIENLHPARNHRTLELQAIFLAAVVFPEFDRAREWRDFALRELAKNMQSDLLHDGVHCELSSDYHHLVLRNYLNARRLASLNDIEFPANADRVLEKALEFSMHVHRPDGKIPSLSDGDSHSYLDLLRQGYELYGREDMLYVATAGRQGIPPYRRSIGFSDAGYYFMRSGWGDRGERYQDERYLVFDCGPLGAGNHGHFDLLSVELYGYGRPLLVDPGRYTYHEDPTENWRVRFRGTAYHNTVLVDGKNQTRYEPGLKKYKVRGLPPVHTLKAFSHRCGFDFVDGVAHSTEYDAIHERRIAFVSPEYWIMCDTLTASQPHRYDLLFHLPHDASGRISSQTRLGACEVVTPNLLLVLCEAFGAEFAVEQGYVSERYGEKRPAPILRFTRSASNTSFHTLLYPFSASPPNLRPRVLPVWRDSREVPGACALRIDIEQEQGHATDYVFFAPQPGVRNWRFCNYRFSGEQLVLRKNAYGQVTRLHMSAGATLEEAGYPVTLEES